jgi:Holliday junction resolvase
MNAKRKGTRAEHRAMRILAAAGYSCLRSGASLGMFDVLALNGTGIRCVQVKSGGAYCSAVEREQIALVDLPPNATREIWRFPDRCRQPVIEVVRGEGA